MDENGSVLWSIFDKEEYIRKVREHFSLADSITDDEIVDFSQSYFGRHLGNYYVVAGNEFELRGIRRPFTSLVEGHLYDDPSQPVVAEPDRFFEMTERLFREGFYVEACIAGRFTLERLLQYEVRDSPEYGPVIEGKERNPDLSKLIAHLRDRDDWPDDLHDKVIALKEHGDWQLHHRFDKMYEGMGPQDFRWGVAKATFGIGGMKSEFDSWLTYVQNRQRRARELSLKSLEYLYEVMSRYRKGPE